MNRAVDVEKAAYDIAGAAERYSVSQEVIRRAIKSGALPAKKPSKKYAIADSALREWWNGLEDA